MVRVIMDEIYGCRPIETMMSDPEVSNVLVFFSSRRRHARYWRDWSSDVCSSDLVIQEISSPGGLSAWLVEDYTVPVVTMNVAFRGGAAQDPEGKAGLANLMSGTMDEGAGDLDSRAFQAKLEDLSINLSFDAGADAFYGNLRTLQQNTDEAFELFRLALTSPRFDAEPVERIRGQILANLRQGETNPNEIARSEEHTSELQ